MKHGDQNQGKKMWSNSIMTHISLVLPAKLGKIGQSPLKANPIRM